MNDRYNELNQLNKEQIEANGKKLSSTFAYNANGQPLTLTFDTEKELEYSYDSLGRLSGKELSLGTPLQYSYSYYLSQRAATSSVTYETNRLKEEILGDAKYVYSYDDRGNITAIQEKIKTIVADEEVIQMEETHSYVYDDKNQLIRENDFSRGKTFVYNYDKGGNLLSRKEYAYTTAETIDETTLENTIEYTYSSQWKDQLAEFNGSEIKYDAIGNPTEYLGKNLTWNGRRLSSYTQNGITTTYTYNADGLRSTKAVGNETTEYYYVGDLLSYEKRGDKELFYTYDFSGNVARIRYISEDGDNTYYPAVNSRGDVEALYNADGTVAVRYYYDTWGNILGIKDGNGQEIEEATHIGLVNPIRYRRYYCDSETGFYYVSSRYYDPEVGRFINADSQLNGGEGPIGYNMYAYCNNNPVMYSDPTGHLPFFAITAAIGAVVGAVVGGVKAAKSGKSVWKGALKGAAVGGLVGLGAGVAGAALITGHATATTAAVLGTASVKLAATGTAAGIAASKGIDYLARGYEKASSAITGATNIYRSVGAAELADIQMSGQFNISEMGMQSKQFAFSYAEVLKFGSHPIINQTNVVSASVPNSMLNQFLTHGVDRGIFTSIMTLYGEQMGTFNNAVAGTIRIMP